MKVLGLASISALAGCSQAQSGPDAETLGQCYRDVQKARIAVQVAGADIPAFDKSQALSALDRAHEDIVLAWAKREGVALTRSDILGEKPNAVTFIEGIDAEAGLSGQAMMNELSRAADTPKDWPDKFETARACADGLTS